MFKYASLLVVILGVAPLANSSTFEVPICTDTVYIDALGKAAYAFAANSLYAERCSKSNTDPNSFKDDLLQITKKYNLRDVQLMEKLFKKGLQRFEKTSCDDLVKHTGEEFTAKRNYFICRYEKRAQEQKEKEKRIKEARLAGAKGLAEQNMIRLRKEAREREEREKAIVARERQLEQQRQQLAAKDAEMKAKELLSGEPSRIEMLQAFKSTDAFKKEMIANNMMNETFRTRGLTFDVVNTKIKSFRKTDYCTKQSGSVFKCPFSVRWAVSTFLDDMIVGESIEDMSNRMFRSVFPGYGYFTNTGNSWRYEAPPEYR